MPAKPRNQANPVDRFETALKELEDIVARMEQGDLPLEDSLKLFERGTRLTRQCSDQLKQAELRVKELSQADAAAEDDAAPIDPEPLDDDSLL